MYGLLDALYSNNERKRDAFKSLYDDSGVGVQFLMRSTIAEALKDCPRIIESHGMDWILCTLASYHKSDDDTVRVFQAIVNKFSNISFGMITDDIKFREVNDLANTCLISLSFFRPLVELMNKRRGAPSVDYYMRAGSLAFHRIGFDGIGDNFLGWVSFIEREMVN